MLSINNKKIFIDGKKLFISGWKKFEKMFIDGRKCLKWYKNFDKW